ncbi:Glycosyl transferases group 1 [compost metagenome]
MDRDLGDLNAYESVRIDEWNAVGKAQVFYASPAMRSFCSISKLLRETRHDLLYLNGFFNPIFTLRPIFVRRFGRYCECPIIVAPRGEFAESALKIKRWKKTVFVFFARISGLFEGVVWHASTDSEANDIQRERRVGRAQIKVAKNISSKSGFAEIEAHEPLPEKAEGAALRVCFLSRIAPMKNLDYALKILANVKSPVQFFIYGPKESPKYWSECEALISRLPSHIEVTYLGAVDPSKVREIIATHDVFFVPTRGENFGHVFMEAFSAGVPILVSDQTPWRDLEGRHLGWDIPLTQPSKFSEALEDFSKFDAARRSLMRESCTRFAIEEMQSEEVLEMNRRLFLDSLDSAACLVN